MNTRSSGEQPPSRNIKKRVFTRMAVVPTSLKSGITYLLNFDKAHNFFKYGSYDENSIQRHFVPTHLTDPFEFAFKKGLAKMYITMINLAYDIDTNKYDTDEHFVRYCKGALKKIEDFYYGNYHFFDLIVNDVNILTTGIENLRAVVHYLQETGRQKRSATRKNYVPGTSFNIPILSRRVSRGTYGSQCSYEINKNTSNPGRKHHQANLDYFKDGKKHSEVHCQEVCSADFHKFAFELSGFLAANQPHMVIEQIDRCIRVRQAEMDEAKGSAYFEPANHIHELKRIINLRKDILSIGLHNIKAITYANTGFTTKGGKPIYNFAIIRNDQAGGQRRKTRKQTRRRR